MSIADELGIKLEPGQSVVDELLVERKAEVRKEEMESIRPLHDRVLIKRLDAEEKSESGILFIPDSAKERPQRGRVVAVGDWVEEIKPGDVVVYGKYSGHDLPDNYLIMMEEDVLCVLEEE
jgi:chaperonin GroES